MSTLHEYLSEYVKTLQEILDQHQNQDDIIPALKNAYPEEDDHRREWILDKLRSGNFKKTLKEIEEKEEHEGKSTTPTNIPRHKQPPEEPPNI
jgi:hypothetical protein